MFTQTNMTFEDLVKIEPGLGKLLEDARKYRPRLNKNCPNIDWYRRYKPKLIKLVGWYARSKDRDLMTACAYDLAYKTVNRAMDHCPTGCQGCSPGYYPK